MAAAPVEGEYGYWVAEGHPNRIEFPPAVVEEICAAAVEGLLKIKKGGLEVGGVLFGAAEGDTARILAWRPLPCEHAYGPSFTLSQRDQANLLSLLESADRDPGLRGLMPVGWFHSHTRTDICLGPDDLDTYDRYFPKPWQVAMVVRPSHFGPSRVGFFIREDDGTVRCRASYQEFTVTPRRTEPEALAPEPTPRDNDGRARRRPLPLPDLPPAQPPAPSEPIAPAPVPSFAAVAGKPGRRLPKRAAAAGLLALIAAGAVFAVRAWNAAAPDRLSLKVTEIDGQLLVEWDRAAKPVRTARSAVIEFLDGSGKTRLDLDSERLREGSVAYRRRTERVDVRFRVNPRESAPVSEWVQFLGPPLTSPQEAEALRQKAELEQEVERLKAELQRRGGSPYRSSLKR